MALMGWASAALGYLEGASWVPWALMAWALVAPPGAHWALDCLEGAMGAPQSPHVLRHKLPFMGPMGALDWFEGAGWANPGPSWAGP